MTLRMAKYRRRVRGLDSLGCTPHTIDLEPEQDSNDDDVLVEEVPNPIPERELYVATTVNY